MVFKLSATFETEFHKYSWRAAALNNFCKKIHLIFHLRGSEFDSDHARRLQDVFKTSSRPLQDVFARHLAIMSSRCLQDIFKTSWKTKNITLKTSSRLLQYVFTKTNVCWDVVVRSFLRTLRTSAGKRLSWKPFLRKFNLFKIDSGKGFFLPVFKTPFYCCFQTLNRSAFLWMITLFFLLNAPKYLGARLFHSLFVKTLHIFWNVFLSKKIC